MQGVTVARANRNSRESTRLGRSRLTPVAIHDSLGRMKLRYSV